MPLLLDYEQRTAWKYEPIHGTFHTHEGLRRKVAPDGGYLPFPGSTVVFRPGERLLETVRQTQARLSRQLDGSGMLAEPLPAAAIHMTLHDLVSPETRAADGADACEAEIAESLRKAAAIAEGIRREFQGRKFVMVPDRIVNMVSKSLALMLKPRTEQDYRLLTELYDRFDGMQKLPYPLTPHITLAYFRPGLLDGDALGAAVDAVQADPGNAPGFAFSPEGIAVQRFWDMQTYMDILDAEPPIKKWIRT